MKLNPEVRASCAENSCGQYGRRWSCPPDCGTLEECEKRIRQHSGGLLLQTVGDLENEFDWEGMKRTEERHKKSFYALTHLLRTDYPHLLPLGAGCCTHCETCTYPDAPCRFPDQCVSSMEAYGILVLQICKDHGMGYYYGPSKTAFTGCILL